tara:strand:+ start:675 stop:941 length:267 start_codon:yes stop_codon:yes gene_type:complete
MALSKQSIRKNMNIIVDGREISKEELILISEGWSENQEIFFRKMLKQGGHFRLKGLKFEIDIDYNPKMRSDGLTDEGVRQIPGEDGRF